MTRSAKVPKWRHFCRRHGLEKCTYECDRRLGKVGSHYCLVEWTTLGRRPEAFRAKALNADVLQSEVRI